MLDLRKSTSDPISRMFSNPMGLPTGIENLDMHLRGLHPGELIIVAGRPGMGKSSLARDIALSVGKESTVLFFSLDSTSEDEVEDLLLVNLAKVNYDGICRDGLTDKVLPQLKKARAQLLSYNIIIDDNSRTTPNSIRQILKSLNKEETVSCVIVDYIQLMSLGKRVGNRQEEVSDISRELAAIAKENSVPVVALSQLNRQLEYRESTRPRLSDLRESGSLEQDAHKVLLLHRPSYYEIKLDSTAEDSGESEILIAKNRKGKTGVVHCGWMSDYMSFVNIPKEDLEGSIAPGHEAKPHWTKSSKEVDNDDF